MKKKGNSKNQGYLQLAIVAVVIAVLTVIAVIGIGPKQFGSVKDISLGLDLAGGVSITYQSVKDDPSSEAMADTIYKLQKRVESYSTESAVYKEGTNRINVDIPGVTDANKILKELGKAGSIQFKTEDGEVVIDGSDIEGAEPASYQEQSGLVKNCVQLTLNAAGTKKFAKATSENVGKVISIWYDGQEINRPVVETAITGGKAQIEQSNYKDAEILATTIRIGALPLELEEIRSNIVGAKLGEEAIKTSLIAGAIGLAIVMIFMIIYYRIPGLAASLALAIYTGLILFLLSILRITLTLPGVAGIILSIGMAVDANVIIFTRIREELATGKTVRSGIKLGFDKALSAIIDGNVTTLIAAAVLYFGGSGTVKGFASTLALGILLSMFTALFVTKYILKAFYAIGFNTEKYYGIQKETKIFQFTKHSKVFFAISAVLILAGFVAMGVNSSNNKGVLNFGLDFKGGTSTQVTLPEDVKVTNAELESFIAETIGEAGEISKIENENSYH